MLQQRPMDWTLLQHLNSSHPHAFGLGNGPGVVCVVVSGLGGEVTVYIHGGFHGEAPNGSLSLELA